MDLVFPLPGMDDVSGWIERNDARTGNSEMITTCTHCIVPIHVWEDSLVDGDLVPIARSDRFVAYDLSDLEDIQAQREASYRACVWYPEIENTIPTAPSLLLDVSTIDMLRDSLNDSIAAYPFVRTCAMSPKDVRTVPLYEDPEEAFDDLMRSERTDDMCHLFVRKRCEYLWEARCFWSRVRLRAVSFVEPHDFTSDDRDEVLAFFDAHGNDIPYHSATVDIGMTRDGLELIEFNTFGPDMKATAGRFSWREDAHTLLSSSEPEFR